MNRALVTGATGFVGRHVPAPLAARGYEVHAITIDPIPEQANGVVWHSGDILDPRVVEEIMARVQPTHLLHLAWNVTHGVFWHSLENLRWTAASLRLLKAFAEQGGRRVVMAGTCAEYDWSCPVLREGSTPLRPATLYGACKHSLNVALESVAAQGKLSAAWGRLFLLYGPHEHPQRLVSSVIRSLLRGEPAECTHGNQVRDFLSSDEAADAFVALLDSDVAGAVNIASGQPMAVRDVVSIIAARIGRPDLVRLGARPAPENDPPRLEAGVERLTREVGWTPHYDLAEGLRRTIAWWAQQDADGRGGH